MFNPSNAWTYQERKQIASALIRWVMEETRAPHIPRPVATVRLPERPADMNLPAWIVERLRLAHRVLNEPASVLESNRNQLMLDIIPDEDVYI